METKHIRQLDSSCIRKIDLKNNEIDVIASTEATDRHREIISSDAWTTPQGNGKDGLSDFLKHPICMTDHSYNVSSVAGVVKKIGVVDRELRAKIRFFTDREAGKDCWDLAKRSVLAVSVGFISHKSLYGEDIQKSKELPQHLKDQALSDNVDRCHTVCSLLELSCIAVPSNPQTLQASIIGGIDLELRGFSRHIQKTLRSAGVSAYTPKYIPQEGAGFESIGELLNKLKRSYERANKALGSGDLTRTICADIERTGRCDYINELFK